MLKAGLIIFFLSGALRALSQDSLFIKDSEPLLVRVLEISRAEVSYKFYFNPDGVVHKVANAQVEKIVYENGMVESRFQLAQKTVVKLKGHMPGTFMIEDNHLSIDGRDITHREAFKIMLKRDPQINSDELNTLLLDAEGKKSAQIAFTLAGPVLFLGSAYLGVRRYYGPADKPQLRGFVLTGLGLFAASEITAIVYKSLKNKKIRKAARLYSNEISF